MQSQPRYIHGPECNVLSPLACQARAINPERALEERKTCVTCNRCTAWYICFPVAPCTGQAPAGYHVYGAGHRLRSHPSLYEQSVRKSQQRVAEVNPRGHAKLSTWRLPQGRVAGSQVPPRISSRFRRVGLAASEVGKLGHERLVFCATAAVPVLVVTSRPCAAECPNSSVLR